MADIWDIIDEQEKPTWKTWVVAGILLFVGIIFLLIGNWHVTGTVPIP